MAREIDVPVIVNNVLGVMFWLSPVIYYPDQLSGLKRTLIVDFNPMAHILMLIRAPFLGTMPSPLNWAVAAGIAIAGWAFALLFFSRFRARVPYWL